MNIHPLLVHFPIAFLTLYAICELIRFNQITKQNYWFYFKAMLVIAGTITAQIAAGTGGMIEEMFAEGPKADAIKNAIVPAHEMTAEAGSGIFLILALTYLVLWVNRDASEEFLTRNPRFAKLMRLASPLANWISQTKAILILSILGLVSLTLAGGLGGAMVHGTDADPLISFIYRLFF
ncbi:MAG: DUF2231 domain-containing protein [Minisyncoccia bacterium]